MIFYISSHVSFSVDPVLAAQNEVAAHLENATELERPGYLTGCCKEPEHLHNVTCNPANYDRYAEALAGLCSVV